jgi:hypothetical protein
MIHNSPSHGLVHSPGLAISLRFTGAGVTLVCLLVNHGGGAAAEKSGRERWHFDSLSLFASKQRS